MTAEPLLAHGMGKELVAPDWPPLTDAEVTDVLRRFFGEGAPEATITWASPRPMSAAGLVRAGRRHLFVKRHHAGVRSVAALGPEHAFADHLGRRGIAVPAVLRTARGAGALEVGDYVYELHAKAPGIDTYRDAVSWSPFQSLGHARAAGAELARLHAAAAGHAPGPRPPALLSTSCCVIAARDPAAALNDLLATRPGLHTALAGRPIGKHFARDVLGFAEAASELLRPLPTQWIHGDWHASNLMWSSAGAGAGVTAVLDLGLSNRSYAVHDLALAIERNAIDWLDLAGSGSVEADVDAVDALLDGYESLRPMSLPESAALVAVLPVAHVEHALSEVEYFATIVGSPGNTELAYESYLLGHARWFEEPAGAALRAHLQRRLGHE